MQNLINALSAKTGKSKDEIKSIYDSTYKLVSDNNPDIKNDTKEFYSILVKELLKMLSIKSENEGSDIGGIKYSDVAPGTTAGFTTFHKTKRKLKKQVNEAYSKLKLSTPEAQLLSILNNQSPDLSISMLESSISDDQLKDSIYDVIKENNNPNSIAYLDSYIKSKYNDKQDFSSFCETFTSHLLNIPNLNEASFEYPGYDLGDKSTLVSVKSSSSKHSVTEAYRNSNSIKTSSLILSSLYRMDEDLYKRYSSFSDINNLLEIKEQLLQYNSDLSVLFSVSYVNDHNEFCTHITNPISETKVLEYCFNQIIKDEGKKRSKFISSYNKLISFCEGETINKIQLSSQFDYSELRDNIIESITNIKDYRLMKKIEQLLL